MADVFGSIAADYDEIRPGYPPELGAAIRAFHGRTPDRIVELGAGTGKGTEVLTGLGGAVTCLEPDPGMAAVLRKRFPGVRVEVSSFEDWDAPPGGADVIGCALAWHWLDPESRNRRARAALAPGGTLAIFGHKYGYADPAVADAISGVLQAVDPTVRDRAEHWVRDDVVASGEFGRVEEHVWHTYPEFTKERFLRLTQTFSPFLKRTPEMRRAALDGLSAVLPETLVLDLTTTLVLATVTP